LILKILTNKLVLKSSMCMKDLVKSRWFFVILTTQPKNLVYLTARIHTKKR